MLVERLPNGQTKAVDMYVLMSAELISTSMRRAYLAAVAGQNRNFVERLTQGESDFVRNLPLFTEITQATVAGQSQRVLDGYQKLPDSLKRDKNFLMLRLQAASTLGNEAVYQAAIDDFLKHHPTDPCVDMVSLDALILKKEFDKTLAAIDRIDKAIGTDNYWELMRGSVLAMAGRFPEARERLLAAERHEPKSVELQWQFVSLSLQEKNFAETANRLSKIRDEFEMVLTDLTKLPDYAEFVRSPEYRAWLAKPPAP
jgi:tetratricopeptide (TPR) repeat protein